MEDKKDECKLFENLKNSNLNSGIKTAKFKLFKKIKVKNFNFLIVIDSMIDYLIISIVIKEIIQSIKSTKLIIDCSNN